MSKTTPAAITILKLGGNIIDHPDQLTRALDYFGKLGGPKILVHGGGRRASALLERLGIQPHMIEGRRVTDEETLEVVVMVYAGLLNKKLVAELQALGVNALGISGADGNLIKASKRPVAEIDYGFAGDVTAVNVNLLQQLLTTNIAPVLCPITHDGTGQLLNTNADTIAAEIAIALAKHGETVRLRYCFEMPGVMVDFGRSNETVSQITPTNYPELLNSGVISGGMQPKLANAMRALAAGVFEIIIGDVDSFIANTATVISEAKARR